MAKNIEQKPTQNGFRLPRVPLAVLGCCIALTTLSYAAVTSQSTDERPLVVFVGDSFTGNYRFDEGQRLSVYGFFTRFQFTTQMV